MPAGTPSLTVICDRFSRVYTGAFTDVMDELGYFHQTLPSGLQPLAQGSRFAGPALPAWGSTSQRVVYDHAVRQIMRCLGEVQPDSVMVVQTNGDSASHMGELCVTWMKARGARGAVIHGGVRDVEYIMREEFPVFALHRTPADCCYRWELKEWNVPVLIADVRIAPGDFIVADADGVICIPQSIALEVLKRGEEVVSTEDHVRSAIRNGLLPMEAYEKFGRF